MICRINVVLILLRVSQIVTIGNDLLYYAYRDKVKFELIRLHWGDPEQRFPCTHQRSVFPRCMQAPLETASLSCGGVQRLWSTDPNHDDNYQTKSSHTL